MSHTGAIIVIGGHGPPSQGAGAGAIGPAGIFEDAAGMAGPGP